MDLQGKVGILTGASRGLGVYFAEALARKGVHLALAARSEADLKETENRISRFGVRSVAVPTDVGDLGDLENLVEATTSELGPPDLLVNNAGVEKYAHFNDVDLDVIERTLRVNVWAPEVLTRLVVPGMIERKRGHIVNVASVAGKTAVPYNAIYSSSKHALVGFSWSLREEVKPHGIGVSVVCPGFVSEAGMFAHWSQGEKPPTMSASVPPEKVAAALITAIERNRPEIIVARGLARFVDVSHAISPTFTTTMARRGGAYRFLRKATERDHRS
ncbi:MAG: SDR family NAD(P)-dependent oxidoreductase [Actinomycetota bacterium]